MKNEKKVNRTKKTRKVENLPTSTILIDKLIFSCTSVVEDNFDYMVIHDPEYWLKEVIPFGQTELVRTQDPSNRYRHSYKVYYRKWLMGILDFCLYNNGIYTNMLRFTVYNEVFYKYRLKYIPIVLDDLNLKINNFKAIDIAIDSYEHNAEQTIRRNLKDKNNIVRLFKPIIKDRDMTLNQITYYNSGSLNNPYQLRSILIKGKDGRKELACYDKKVEIEKISKKDYILKFHQEQNPKCKKIYRAEIRFQYEELRRYIEKIKRPITFDDLLDPQFLNDMFFEYLDRIITIYRGTGKKKTKVQLVDRPKIESSEGILQPTLPIRIADFHNGNINSNYKMKYDNENNILTISYDKNKYSIENIKYEIFIYEHNNLNKYLSIYEKNINNRPQTKNQRSYARC